MIIDFRRHAALFSLPTTIKRSKDLVLLVITCKIVSVKFELICKKGHPRRNFLPKSNVWRQCFRPSLRASALLFLNLLVWSFKCTRHAEVAKHETCNKRSWANVWCKVSCKDNCISRSKSPLKLLACTFEAKAEDA